MVHLEGEPELLEMIGALRSPCSFSSHLNGGQQQGHQNTDDRDDDEQFDEREARAILFTHCHDGNFF